LNSGIAKGEKGGRRFWAQALRAYQHSFHSFESAFLSRNLNQIMPKTRNFRKNFCKNRRSIGKKGENPTTNNLA